MPDDLRRLVREGHFVPDVAQAILALLDERDELRHGRDRWRQESLTNAAMLSRFRNKRDAAERRVSALEAERDGLLVRLGQCAERAKAAECEARALLDRCDLLEAAGLSTFDAEAAERRVAALEEGLRGIVEWFDAKEPGTLLTSYGPGAQVINKARALLAAAPSELHLGKRYEYVSDPKAPAEWRPVSEASDE